MSLARLPIDLGALEAVIAVAETGSFSAAAGLLSISQSAVSSRIRVAEEVLGVELFHRTTRRVILSEHGARLKARAGMALSDLQAIIDEFRDEARLIRGRVNVGATPTVSAIVLPGIVRAFQDTYPGIRVTIYDDFFGMALERVMRGEVDFAIAPYDEHIDNGSLLLEKFLFEEMVVIVPEGHPLAEGDFSLQRMAQYPIVSMPPHSATYHYIHRLFAEHGLSFEPTMQTMHALSSIAITRSGLASAFIPVGLQKICSMHGLVTLRLPDKVLGRSIAIATAPDRSLTPAARALTNLIRISHYC
ncbi:DNA-binding transcriptional LysR family regulator [Pseudochelatococcus lubricantis]|uniref:DNA-binding transcriptional LysR family regulator n=1 Tax=Pseudochelatococcus lubricantis TaxID=1538102 RepID=A0ABX0V442_9HYPH|nr:LysR family transcriptional regulator [Pseudochelatococcus lubricantis]NIJ59150.1 DNA-binding transcriptional LysR family regulator [Pseudochelatococcus lubricantis]